MTGVQTCALPICRTCVVALGGDEAEPATSLLDERAAAAEAAVAGEGDVLLVVHRGVTPNGK